MAVRTGDSKLRSVYLVFDTLSETRGASVVSTRADQSGFPLIIGVGNACRSDDGVGIAVARRLRDAKAPARIIDASGEGAALMELWRPYSQVTLVDAVRSGGRPGRIVRIDATRQRVPSDFFHYSTHAFSVAEAVEMARALDVLPARLVIYGIEGADFSPGFRLTPAVNRAADEVARRLLDELFGDGAIGRESGDQRRTGESQCTNSL
ncbi:MAG: hydrogenase maturation protease [Planctomycetota bacterium]|nr:MAG: hydrogenase maturation protease [Planctomycetota bacterium]